MKKWIIVVLAVLLCACSGKDYDGKDTKRLVETGMEKLETYFDAHEMNVKLTSVENVFSTYSDEYAILTSYVTGTYEQLVTEHTYCYNTATDTLYTDVYLEDLNEVSKEYLLNYLGVSSAEYSEFSTGIFLPDGKWINQEERTDFFPLAYHVLPAEVTDASEFFQSADRPTIYYICDMNVSEDVDYSAFDLQSVLDTMNKDHLYIKWLHVRNNKLTVTLEGNTFFIPDDHLCVYGPGEGVGREWVQYEHWEDVVYDDYIIHKPAYTRVEGPDVPYQVTETTYSLEPTLEVIETVEGLAFEDVAGDYPFYLIAKKDSWLCQKEYTGCQWVELDEDYNVLLDVENGSFTVMSQLIRADD